MKKTIWIMTLFGKYFDQFLETGVIANYFKKSDTRYEIKIIDITQYNLKGFKGVDDSPFGGGAGMVIRADILKDALVKGILTPNEIDIKNIKKKFHIICPMPRGRTWNQEYAQRFAHQYFQENFEKELVFICGRYEGIDERFLNLYVDEFISVGDYILTGGELAVMSILDSSLRLTKGVLGNKNSLIEESFNDGLLEYPLYTRPRLFDGIAVPDEYLDGHHKKINELKQKSRIKLTKKYRPDLLNEDE